MLIMLALLFPVALLVLMLVMERVERPLRRDAVGEQVAASLEAAQADELESFVSDGFASALESYWRRRRLGRLLSKRKSPARVASTPTPPTASAPAAPRAVSDRNVVQP